MRNQFLTPAIMLSRVDYGEADRIITFLTPEHGKLAAMAKGVRRSTSKLAGGIELFSESSLTLLKGRGEVYTLVSSSLVTYWDAIVKDLARTMFAYEALKQINKIADEGNDHGLYDLLKMTLEQLNGPDILLPLIECWFYLRFLLILGHAPQLDQDAKGDPLDPSANYSFSMGDMVFFQNLDGEYSANHLKLLRLMQKHTPEQLKNIQKVDEILADLLPLVKNMLSVQLSR